MIDRINIEITPIQGMSPTERAKAISRELYAISRPPKVRTEIERTDYLFGWIEHPTQARTVLLGIKNYTVNVHEENDLTNLLSLFPDINNAELNALAGYIKIHNAFEFNDIIPSNANILSDAQMIEQGFITPLEL